jgi:hypothetical protein
MARDNNGNWIRPVGKTHSAYSLRASDLLRESSVRSRSAARNPAKSAPDLLLKHRANGLHRKVVDCAQLTREIAGYGLGDAVGILHGLNREPVFTVATPKVTQYLHLAVRKERNTQVTALVGNDAHGADGREELVGEEV